MIAPAAYDSTGAITFKEKTPSPVARFESGTAVVGDKFYIMGGHVGEDLDVTTVVYSYDPLADAWSRHADMPVAVTHFTAAVESDRYIWYTGGYAGKHPGKAVDQTWRYDTVEDRFASFVPLPALRASCGCAIVGRKLHVFGGLGEDRNTNFAEHWTLDLDDPARWEVAAAMPNARAHFGTAVVDGFIYAIGGHYFHDCPDRAKDQSTADLDFVHRYDPAQDRWEEVRYLPMRRSHVETATLVHDGNVLILGGRNNSPHAVPRHLRRSIRVLPKRVVRKIKRTLFPEDASATERNGVAHVTLYNPTCDEWTDAGSLPIKLYACAAGIVGNQLIVTNGGRRGWQDPNEKTFVAELKTPGLRVSTREH